METILEELNEGVVVLDDELRVIFANEALTRMGHFDREEIQGRTPDAIFPSEDLPSIKRQHESGLRYGRNRTEFYVPRKDGGKIPAIFSGRVIQGPDKQDYVLLTVTDISAQKRIEEQLRESNSLLQKRQDEIRGHASCSGTPTSSAFFIGVNHPPAPLPFLVSRRDQHQTRAVKTNAKLLFQIRSSDICN